MAQMSSVYRKLLDDALNSGKSLEEAQKIAEAGSDVALVSKTKKRLAATFEGEAATKAGSATQIRAMKRRGGTIPGINQPAPLTEDEKRLKRAGLSDKQIRALKGK